MTTILGAAVSGMLANQIVLDHVGNNIANYDAQGYKRSRPISEGSVEPAASPEKSRLGVTSTISDFVLDPGTPVITGEPLNFMIADDAYFRVTTPAGASVYARVGLLNVETDGGIRMNSLDLDPPMVAPDGSHSISVDADGVVSGTSADGEALNFGTINLVRFFNPKGLRDIGGGLYTETANSGAIVEGTPGTNGFDQLITGALEGSNVEVAEEMASMIIAQRSYQACARTFTIADEMLKLATNITR